MNEPEPIVIDIPRLIRLLGEKEFAIMQLRHQVETLKAQLAEKAKET